MSDPSFFSAEAGPRFEQDFLGKPTAEEKNRNLAMQNKTAKGMASAADTQRMIAKGIWNQSSLVRNPLMERLKTVAQSNFDPTLNPYYNTLKQAAGNQYGQATSGISSRLGDNPLTQHLQEQSGNVGKNQLSTIMANMIADEYTRSLNMATGQPGRVFSGLTDANASRAGAGGVLDKIAQQQTAQQASAQAGTSAGIGAIASLIAL
jgi:hypothetical protein